MSKGRDLQSETIPLPSSLCTCSGSEVIRAPCPALRPVPTALAEIGPLVFWKVGLSKRTKALGERGLFLPGHLPRKLGEGRWGQMFSTSHEETEVQEGGLPHYLCVAELVAPQGPWAGSCFPTLCTPLLAEV